MENSGNLQGNSEKKCRRIEAGILSPKFGFGARSVGHFYSEKERIQPESIESKENILFFIIAPQPKEARHAECSYH
jgi:hypothetical protein